MLEEYVLLLNELLGEHHRQMYAVHRAEIQNRYSEIVVRLLRGSGAAVWERGLVFNCEAEGCPADQRLAANCPLTTNTVGTAMALG